MNSDKYYRIQFSNLPPFLEPIYTILLRTELNNAEIHNVLKETYKAIDSAREDEAEKLKSSFA